MISASIYTTIWKQYPYSNAFWDSNFSFRCHPLIIVAQNKTSITYTAAAAGESVTGDDLCWGQSLNHCLSLVIDRAPMQLPRDCNHLPSPSNTERRIYLRLATLFGSRMAWQKTSVCRKFKILPRCHRELCSSWCDLYGRSRSLDTTLFDIVPIIVQLTVAISCTVSDIQWVINQSKTAYFWYHACVFGPMAHIRPDRVLRPKYWYQNLVSVTLLICHVFWSPISETWTE